MDSRGVSITQFHIMYGLVDIVRHAQLLNGNLQFRVQHPYFFRYVDEVHLFMGRCEDQMTQS